MVDRKVEFDVVAKDKASDKVDDVGDALERAGKKADDANNRFGAFASRVSEVGRTVATAGGKVAAFASLVGPLTSGVLGVGKALAMAGQSVAGLAPLAAFAPSVIGGWKFLKWTITGIGKQMSEELKPLGKDFEQLQVDAGKLASDGIGKIGDEFKRANFPAIREAMNGIGQSTNENIKVLARWVNGAQGQQLIRETTLGVKEAFEQSVPWITSAGIALGRMANRADIRGFLRMLGEDVGNIAWKFEKWADSISSQDITEALSDVGDAFMRVRDTFIFLRDVGRWMGENEGKVRAFSDALAVLGIVLGAFTGNPLAVVVGSLTLLINHWDTVKSKLSGAGAWWSATWSAISNDPSVQSILQSLKDIAFTVKGDLQAAWDMLQPALAELGEMAAQAWQQAGPLVAQFFRDPNVVAGIRAIALAVAALVFAFVAFSAATAATTAAVTAALAGFIAWFTGVVVRGILNGLADMIQKFGEWLVSMGRMAQAIPGLGQVGAAMIRAGQDAQTAAGQVRGLADSIAQLKSKTVTVTVNNVVNTIRQESDGTVYISDGRTTHRARARGGIIPGQRSAFDRFTTTDVAPGEFLVNARATSRNLPLLERINSGAMPTGGGGGNTYITVPVTVHAGALGSEDFLARTVSEMVETSIRQGRGSGVFAAAGAGG